MRILKCCFIFEKVAMARSFGIDLIIDPGFGFAKTIAQNYEVFKKWNCLILELPLLMEFRKSMIYKTLDTSIENALNGTTVLNTLLTKGAKILRVHDVKEAMGVLFNKINL
jgi:dihydropteroate synthase